MHFWRPLIAAFVFASFGTDAAVVYKWTDTDGVVHFSDQPVPGAERIVTAAAAENGLAVGSSATTPGVPRKSAAGGLAGVQMSIISPANEQVFFNDDVVTVQLHLSPNLAPSQTILWSLNGSSVGDQPSTATSFSLPALPRGAYSISATVTDTSTGESRSTESVTFYVRQPSELGPQHKKS